MATKKGFELSFNVVVIVIIVLVFLLLVLMFYTGQYESLTSIFSNIGEEVVSETNTSVFQLL